MVAHRSDVGPVDDRCAGEANVVVTLPIMADIASPGFTDGCLSSLRSCACRRNSAGQPCSPSSWRAPTSRSPRPPGRWKRSWRGARPPPNSARSWSRCGRRARRSMRSSASATRCSRTPSAAGCGSDGARHRRHGRRPVRHGQRLDDVVDRRCGGGCSGRQARQQGGELRLGLVGCAGRARRRPHDRAGARRAGAREVGHHLRVRGAVPPRLQARRADACRARASRRSSTSSARCATPPVPRRRRWASPHLDKVPLFVGVFQTRGATALVFRGDDGLDELSTTGHSHIWEVSRGAVTEHDLDPADLGLPRATIDELRGGDAAHNAEIARRVLAGEKGPVRDIVLLNAAAGPGLVGARAGSTPGPRRTSGTGSATRSPSPRRPSTRVPPSAKLERGSQRPDTSAAVALGPSRGCGRPPCFHCAIGWSRSRRTSWAASAWILAPVGA